MSADNTSNQGAYAQILSNRAEAGFVEAMLLDQIARQYADGELDARHAASVALAVLSARNVDSMGPGEKAYAKAQLITATNAVFSSLPKPVERSTDDFQETVRSIMFGAEADQSVPMYVEED